MKNKDFQYTVGIVLIIVGGIIAVAGLGGVGASFVVGADLSTRDVGIGPLDFIANHFRTICASQIPLGLLTAIFGRLLIRKPNKKERINR